MAETTLLVVRHGNTFGPEETPRRVGARTDIDLVESGREQARILGLYLKEHELVPDSVYAAGLKRAFDTARIALGAVPAERDIQVHRGFDEIDYGPDENKTEEEVIARIGQEAIDLWNKDALVPKGWQVDPASIIRTWIDFGATCTTTHQGQTIMIATSNGIARFAPHLCGNFEEFCQKHPIKISTGALCVFTHNGSRWSVDGWNIKPKKWFENKR